MTCSGKSNGEHLQGVMCLLFFFSPQVIFPLHSFLVTFLNSTDTPLSFQEFFHLQRRDLFLKLFSKRMSAQCLGVSVCGTESLWSHPPFLYLLISSPHTYFVSFMPQSCVLLSIADPWVTVVFLGLTPSIRNLLD